MAIEIVQEVIDEAKLLGSEMWADAGLVGAAIYTSIKYDTTKAFDAAVAAGKYAANSFVALSAQALGDFWLTAKSQIAAKWAIIYGVYQANGYQAAINEAQTLLANIDWRAVATSLTGIGEATLGTVARAFLQMFIAGVLAPVA